MMDFFSKDAFFDHLVFCKDLYKLLILVIMLWKTFSEIWITKFAFIFSQFFSWHDLSYKNHFSKRSSRSTILRWYNSSIFSTFFILQCISFMPYPFLTLNGPSIYKSFRYVLYIWKMLKKLTKAWLALTFCRGLWTDTFHYK